MSMTMQRTPAGADGWQPDLFSSGAGPEGNEVGAPRRTVLDERCWLDHAIGWCGDAASTFDALVAHQRWEQPSRLMYDSMVCQPRLSAWQVIDDPDVHPAVADMACRLNARYETDFRSVGVNLYRSGTDSVAWHGDRIGRRHVSTTVAIVALGERRPFLVRPTGGGPSRRWTSGQGDLLVMGGECQRRWQHAVPKVARAGPRISVVFREDEREGVLV